MSELLPITLRIDEVLVYENIIDVYDEIIPASFGGYVTRPPDIALSITFESKPEVLLKYAMACHMMNKVVLDYRNGRTVEFEMVIINRIDNIKYDNVKCRVNMSALRMNIFLSEQEKKEYDLMLLINRGEIFLGVKKHCQNI